MESLVTLAEIQAAATRLEGVAVATPLVPFPLAEPRLLVKPESLQPTGSFKLRGAHATISALTPDERERGVVAHSSGNHAIAVAYAAGQLGVAATVVIPRTAPRAKTDLAGRFGARIVTVEPGMQARAAATADLVARYGYTEVLPFDHRQVIAGQGTIGLEIAAQCPSAGLVVVPVSGGGLISGIATAVRALCPAASVVGVEPELAASTRESLARGERVAWSPAATAATIADALRVEQVGELTFAHIRRHVDAIVTVTEDELREAVRRTAIEARLVAEPGGAAAIAACLFHRHELPPAETTVAILSGGNVAPSLFTEILAGA